jgi:isopentenyl diphosphate isomerase/L-lactate dehydrogenase-like FMN-dependent dehydrogenase
MPDSPNPPLAQIPPQISRAADYESLAERFIAAPTLAYLTGGSGEDRTLAWNRAAFERLRLTPRVFAALADACTATTLLGRRLPHPVLLAPVAYQGLVHPQAEVDSARGAAATDTVTVLSSLATRQVEEVAGVATAGWWYQLWLGADRRETLARLRRAEQAGCAAIVVTVDAAAQLPSRRAQRAGFVLPPGLAADPPPPAGGASIFERYRNAAVRREDLAWLLEVSARPVIVKGVLHPADAAACRELGAAGIVVSNHGGRTVDGVTASLDALTGIRAAVGEQPTVLLDGGIRSGEDVLKAVAAGADAVLIGRLQVYALAVAGALGVAHMLRLLREELELYMAVTGCASLRAARDDGLLTKVNTQC